MSIWRRLGCPSFFFVQDLPSIFMKNSVVVVAVVTTSLAAVQNKRRARATTTAWTCLILVWIVEREKTKTKER